MTHNSTWDDLRITLAVAEAGSVNAAAKALGLNHATILRRVAAFERARGVTLFERSARGAAIAPGAAPLIERLRAVEAAVQGFDRAAAGHAEPAGALRGALRLTTTDSLALTVLPRLVARFLAAHPAMRVEIAATNARLDLARLDAELTIRPSAAAPEGLVAERAGTMRMRVHGAAGYLAANPSADPAAHRWLGASALLARSPAARWQERLPEGRLVLRADSFVTLAALARGGLGLAMLPDAVADGLAPAPGFPDVLETRLWVAAHPDLAETPRVAACRRFFAAALREEPAFADQ